MPTTAQLAMARPNVNDARCEALFASALQPSDVPIAEMAGRAINCTVRQFGIGGCAGRMAQEFGDHPDAAAERMRGCASSPGRPDGHSAPRRGEAGDERDV
jgi:hypothetical protein